MKNIALLLTSIMMCPGCFFFLQSVFGKDNCRAYGTNKIPFYDKNPESLKKEISEYFGSVSPSAKLEEGQYVSGIVAPHAGYTYAGKIYAEGYQYFKDRKIKNVFVIGFSHRYYIPSIDVGNWDSVATPLGNIPVNKEIVADLLKNKVFASANEPAQNLEWSTENQFPFVYTVFKDVKIVVLLVGELDKEEMDQAAEVLRKYVSPENAFIISSDFTHYGTNFDYTPFSEKLKESIHKLDNDAADLIAKKDLKGFQNYIQKTGATICGRAPISLFLDVIQPMANVDGQKLAYITSADETGDYETLSVGYASIIFKAKKVSGENKSEKSVKDEKSSTEEKPVKPEKDDARKSFREELFGPADEPDAPVLTDAEKLTLMKIARDMLDNCTKNHKYHPDFSKYDITENLKKPCRVFVTLKIDGELRGCIGFSHAELPLAEAVVKSTYNSCYEDPRFDTVTADEAKKIHFDISVNTPPRLAKNGYKDIELGKHGIYLVNWSGGRPHIATFLPMVATEQGWDVPTTLSYLSRKAGISSEAWKSPETEFYLYTSQVIEEKK